MTEPTRYVVDGLALVRAVLGWVEDHAPGATGTLFQTLASRPAGYPWGTKPGALPLPTEPDKLTGVLRGIDAANRRSSSRRLGVVERLGHGRSPSTAGPAPSPHPALNDRSRSSYSALQRHPLIDIPCLLSQAR